MYEIAFTEGFRDGLRHLPKEIYSIIDRQLIRLAVDPFANDRNRTRLKGGNGAFRARIGIHVRMLYRVLSRDKRVIVQTITTREAAYRSPGERTPLTDADNEAILAEIRRAPKIALPTVDPNSPDFPLPPPLVPDLPVEVELLDWLIDTDLFLLHIPETLWQAILDCGGIDAMQRLPIDDHTKSVIEDYWTHPAGTQVEKIYQLGAGQGVEAIAEQPLSRFMIALDPDQKDAIAKIKADGPYLLKGGAGAGKSLVGLYYIRDMILHGSVASLLDAAPNRYGAITYTNALVDANHALLQSLLPASMMTSLRCVTLDSVAYELAKKELGVSPSQLGSKGIAKWLEDQIAPKLAATEREILVRLGYSFVADEIEQVINGYGLDSISEYLDLTRTGRKRALQQADRRAIWLCFERFNALCGLSSAITYEQTRRLALRHLRNNPTYPRFAALFVDEAQDFSKTARRLCLELVQDPRFLLLAADTGQSIYCVPPTWKESDSRLNFVRRKPIKLERGYRLTQQISAAIAPLRRELNDGEEFSATSQSVFSGPKPQWLDEDTARHLVVATEIVKSHLERHVNLGQIAIIVRENSQADRYVANLIAHHIPARAVRKGSPLDLNSAHVHVMTAHACKGLGFPVVVVPEVGASHYPWRFAIEKSTDERQADEIRDAEQRVLYVALSRASHQLHMIVNRDAPSPFLSLLDRASWS
jgi:superfamily I DNA/RNA helicase/mRNA-degrading endonuclease RelE of RelBE toxin-antitoxin system